MQKRKAELQRTIDSAGTSAENTGRAVNSDGEDGAGGKLDSGGKKGGRKNKEAKQPRTGAKANKEALEEIRKKLDDCVVRDEFDKATSDVQRALASVTVFKAQMKIFEKKFMSDRALDSSITATNRLSGNTDKVFSPPDSVDCSKSKISLSIEAAARMKKTLQSNINRIDLLTDSKIGDIKGLLTSLSEQLVNLNKRITYAESEMYKKEYDNIPCDVMALTKSEF